MFQVILPHVTVQDLPSPSAWLDVVWSLVVLEQAATQHVASVLDPNFCIKLSVDTGLSTAKFEFSLFYQSVPF